MSINRIISNSAFLFFSTIVNKLIMFVYFILLVRYLPKEEYGTLTFWLSFIPLIFFLTDVGLGTYTVRELSMHPDLKNQLFANVFVIKILITSLLYIGNAIFLLLFINDFEFIKVGLVLICSLCVDSFIRLSFSYFQAFKRMIYQAILIGLNSIFMISSGLVSYLIKMDVIYVGFFHLLSNVLTLVISYYLLINKFLNLNNILLQIKNFKFKNLFIIQKSVSFGLSVFMFKSYDWIENTFLLIYYNKEAVAIYNNALNLILPFVFLGIVINAAVFPFLAEFSTKDNINYSRIFQLNLKILLMIPFLSFTIFYFFSDAIVVILYGIEYSETIIVLKILSFSIITKFVRLIFKQYYETNYREKTFMILTLLALILNVISSFLLIPSYGYIGSAISRNITMFFYITISYLVYKKIKKENKIRFIKLIIKYLLITIIIGIVACILKNRIILNISVISLFIKVSTISVLFLLLLFLFKIVEIRDVKNLLSILQKKRDDIFETKNLSVSSKRKVEMNNKPLFDYFPIPIQYLMVKFRCFMSKYPHVYEIYFRIFRGKRDYPYVTEKTDIVIEGFSGSANTFAYQAFVFAQKKQYNIAHHTHIVGQIIKAIKLKKPILLLIRNPKDTLISNLTKTPYISPYILLMNYIHYYHSLMRYKSKFVVADFSEVTSDFSKVIGKVNSKFKTDFRVFIHTEENVKKVFEIIRKTKNAQDKIKKGYEYRVALPSKEKELLKEQLKYVLNKRNIQKLLVQANKIYEDFYETHC